MNRKRKQGLLEKLSFRTLAGYKQGKSMVLEFLNARNPRTLVQQNRGGRAPAGVLQAITGQVQSRARRGLYAPGSDKLLSKQLRDHLSRAMK